MRDEEGNYIAGFTMDLGVCSTNEVEAWGLLKGLQVAWEKGIRRVMVMMDSKYIIKLFNNHGKD